MKLDQFVTQTLVSIVEGVKNADKEAHEKNLVEYAKGSFGIHDYGGITDGHCINFDVAVTASSQVSGDAKSSGDILVASLSANVEASKNFESISRVKFKVMYKGC